jgi:hypothetical protein
LRPAPPGDRCELSHAGQTGVNAIGQVVAVTFSLTTLLDPPGCIVTP